MTPPPSIPGTRWFSLRRRLMLWLLAGVTIGWLGAVGYTFVNARHEIEELVEALEEHEHDSDEQRRHLRHELLEHFVSVMLAPLLIGLPLLGGWIWFATRQGLAPLAQIADEVARREPDHLEPLTPASAPRELQPLLDAMNTLFGRVATTLERERAFTADAAHELRTPLAALTTQAEVASRARDAAEREHALAQIIIGSRRASRLVEQLLTLARLEPAPQTAACEVRLDTLAAEVCADHGAMALEREIELDLETPGNVELPGNADMLRVLLRNLLDNALRYTPPGGRVKVAIKTQGASVQLSVADSGPGIPREQRAEALCRFRRFAGQDIEGSGLGLSIVARIAELHGARLELADGIGDAGNPGLAVSLVISRRV